MRPEWFEFPETLQEPFDALPWAQMVSSELVSHARLRGVRLITLSEFSNPVDKAPRGQHVPPDFTPTRRS